MIDHLQKEKVNIEELKEELNNMKNMIENLNNKNHQYEKDTSYMSMLVDKLETEVRQH